MKYPIFNRAGNNSNNIPDTSLTDNNNPCNINKTPISVQRLLYVLIIIPFVFLCVISGKAKAENIGIKTIIILPFGINSQNDISFIKAGIVQMLNSRLSWKDHVLVIDGIKDKVQEKSAKAILKNSINKKKRPNAGETQILTDYDYILSGNITEFAGAFSIDIKVFNVRNKKSRSFFIQAGSMEKIIPGIDILAAEINKKIFNRTTETLKKIVNHGKNIESKKERMVRQNPEKFMEEQFGRQEQKDRPFWKFWGKNNPDDTNVEPEKKEKPFWEIW